MNDKFDRDMFILWAQGIIMDNSQGKVICIDEQKYEDAVKYMENGGIIELSKNGNVITTMKLVNGKFEEEAI